LGVTYNLLPGRGVMYVIYGFIVHAENSEFAVYHVGFVIYYWRVNINDVFVYEGTSVT
jgi:hypothetical protein